ncbi:MAG: magnesium transporter CorA family protein [Bauldia sp.]|nr:magnesium transporter CorA family protein [Bauldia sp.]
MAYTLTPGGPIALPETSVPHDDPRVSWIDLLNPTSEEDGIAEKFLGVSIPTQEEAAEIEFSSRFYSEESGQFLTISVLAGVDAGTPVLTPLTFVLSRDRLATVRYEDFAAFRQFLVRSTKVGDVCAEPVGVMVTLLESIIDRIADVVERTSAEVDKLNREIFMRDSRGRIASGKRRERKLEGYLVRIGFQNDIVSKTRESLSSIERMLQYVSATGSAGQPLIHKSESPTIKLMARDVRSLTDHLSFLSNRATFLLDATLGMISVQQNEVISVLTVAATILLPPTLIGTIYGMNFTRMPELDWTFGYPIAILVMVASAVVPYLILKRRGWF